MDTVITYEGAVSQGPTAEDAQRLKNGEVASTQDFDCDHRGINDSTSGLRNLIAQTPRGGMAHVIRGVYAHSGDLALQSKNLLFIGDGYAQPRDWYQRVGSPVTPTPANIGNLGSFLWNTGASQHFKPGTPTTQAIVGDGVVRTWALDSRANYITDGDVNGVAVTFGLDGETGKDFYLGADRQTITQDAGGATLTGSQALTIHYGMSLVDVHLAFRDMGFYGGSGVIKIPNMNTSLNFDVESVVSMFCTGAAFELGEDDVTGNAYMSRFNKCYFYNNVIGILNHFACDVNVDDCFFQDHTSRAIECRAANTRVTKSTFISGNTGTEDILLVPTGFLTSNALYNLHFAHNKFGNENSVSGETRVKIRVGTPAIKASDPDFYVANLDVHDNTFVGTFPLPGLPTACIALHSPMQDSSIHHNKFITATYAVDDSDATQSAVGCNSRYEDNIVSFGTSDFRAGGVGFSEIRGSTIKADSQPSAVDHQLIENCIALSEAFDGWSLFALTVTTGQSDRFGGTSACRLNKTGAFGSVGLGCTTTEAGSHVFSVFLKPGSFTSATIELQDVSGNVLNRRPIGLDSEWRRYALRVTGIPAASILVAVIYPDTPASATTGDIYAFAGQINSGDEAGGYVRTDSVAISRTHGLRSSHDMNVGRDLLVDRDAEVTGDLVVTGDGSVTTQTATLATRVVHPFGSVVLLEDETGFGIRLILNDDGTLRIQRTLNGFSSIDPADPIRINSGEVEIQVLLKLSAVTASRLLKTDGSGVVVAGNVSLASGSPDITGTLSLVNGGLGATTAAAGRITLDVYSKSDVDGMVAAIYAAMATAGASTGTTSGHSHVQT